MRKKGAAARASSLPEALYNTRPCRWMLTYASCYSGDACPFAHSEEELQPLPESEQRLSLAPHWCGASVAIGIVEFALFSEPIIPGTINIVCNRTTCLGNPFAWRQYGPDEQVPTPDREGWIATEHEEYCQAFDEYLNVVLDDEANERIVMDPDAEQQHLALVVADIAERHSMRVVESWTEQCLTAADVWRALRSLGERVAAGQRIRLLCHCRPHVRCHTEYLKAHLETIWAPTVPPPMPPQPPCNAKSPWPTFSKSNGAPTCATCRRCAPGGLDPLSQKNYCAFCWSSHVNDTFLKSRSGEIRPRELRSPA